MRKLLLQLVAGLITKCLDYLNASTKLSREGAVGNPSAIEGQTAKMNSRTGL